MLSIPQGTRIFIDSNIFIYHFLGQSESCRSLLEMAENLDIRAYASVVVLAEVLHKLMITEAAEKFGIKPYDAVRFLKGRPELISELKKCEAAVGEIPDYNIEILSIGSSLLQLAVQRDREDPLVLLRDNMASRLPPDDKSFLDQDFDQLRSGEDRQPSRHRRALP